MNNFGEKVSFIWNVADLLRGPYRPNQYKDLMLPMNVRRQTQGGVEPGKNKVGAGLRNLQAKRPRASTQSFID